ncbi:MAG TPA: FlgD immunoglobulin-like domain containing protein, partial [Candidatus Limnocylindrales bacterium]
LDSSGNYDVGFSPPAPAGSYELRAHFVGSGIWQSSTASQFFTSVGRKSTTTLSATPNPPDAYAPFTLTADVTSNLYAATGQSGHFPTGTVTFYDVTGTTPVLLGSDASQILGAYDYDHAQASIQLPNGFDVGTRTLRATYVPDTAEAGWYAGSTSANLPLAIAKATTSTYLDIPTIPEANTPFQIGVEVFPQVAKFANGATVTVTRSGSATPLCSVAAVMPETFCMAPGLPQGSYTLTATYSGDIRALPSASDPYPLTIGPNLVHATGVGVSSATIYPVTDGYLDTVAVKGTRDEAINVAIQVFNSSNSLVRSASIASGTGAYSYAWNGRTSGGTVLAEGTYKVVQTLYDANGGKLVVTSSMVLSKKFLHWHTSSVSKTGANLTAFGEVGNGDVSVNTTTGQVRLTATSLSSDVASAGWEFLLPAATSYRSMVFRVYASHTLVAGGIDDIGAQNFSTCPRVAGDWADTCFDQLHAVGNGTGAYAWYATSTLTSAHWSGRYIRGFIEEVGGVTYVNTAQVTFQYSTLSY